MPTPEEIAKTARRLARKKILVGVPQEKDPRKGEQIGNASLAYIHNYGSPARNIPARPFIEPGIKAARKDIDRYLREGALAVVEGNERGVDAALTKAGIAAVNEIRATIEAGIPPPLKRGRPHRGQGPADAIPLIDTGSMLASISWAIKDK